MQVLRHGAVRIDGAAAVDRRAEAMKVGITISGKAGGIRGEAIKIGGRAQATAASLKAGKPSKIV